MTIGELIVLVFWGSCLLVSWFGFEHTGLMGTVILLAGFSLLAIRENHDAE